MSLPKNTTPTNVPEYTFKIGLLGDEGTGKTSLVNRFIEGKFEIDYKPTLGVSILTKKISIKNPDAIVNLVIWDIAGQQKYQNIRPMYFQGCLGVIFVYDVTRPLSFSEIKTKWMPDFKQFSTPDTCYSLVGNKKDLLDKVKITTEQGKLLAKEIGVVDFFETSAMTGENVQTIFENLVKKLIQRKTIPTASTA